MRNSQLRAFHNVALHGGFSKAARALSMTQPSISDQVKRLEQAYDVQLFHRESRQVRLTEPGEKLFRLTLEYYEVEDRIGLMLDQSRAAVKGTLRIVADSAHHITGAVSMFRKKHAEVFVSLQSGNTETVLRRLRNYEADVGVVGNLAPVSDLDFIDLGRTPIVAITKHGYLPDGMDSLSLSELQKYPLVFRENGSRTRANLEAESARQNIDLVPSIEVEGREAMREIVASGAGIGFVSEAELGHDQRIVPVQVKGADLGMSESLVTLAARRDVPIIRVFLRMIGEHV